MIYYLIAHYNTNLKVVHIHIHIFFEKHIFSWTAKEKLLVQMTTRKCRCTVKYTNLNRIQQNMKSVVYKAYNSYYENIHLITTSLSSQAIFVTI